MYIVKIAACICTRVHLYSLPIEILLLVLLKSFFLFLTKIYFL